MGARDDTGQSVRCQTGLSALVERAAKGEEIVITRHGAPRAKLVPLTSRGKPHTPAGALGVTHVSDDFDAPDPVSEAIFNRA
ncbi:MAG: type II toxin-antitoxin system prevent-host-death family antitoxin [Caulobacteraceae bacterium]